MRHMRIGLFAMHQRYIRQRIVLALDFWHGQGGQNGDTNPCRRHVAQRFERRAFKIALQTVFFHLVQRRVRRRFQHMIAETMPCAQYQQGLFAQLVTVDLRFFRQWMRLRQGHEKRLIVHGFDFQTRLGNRQRQNRRIQPPLFHPFDQMVRVLLLHDQRHLRVMLKHMRH